MRVGPTDSGSIEQLSGDLTRIGFLALWPKNVDVEIGKNFQYLYSLYLYSADSLFLY